MRYFGYVVAVAALAVAVTGCGDPYAPRYGNAQSYYPQSPGYSYYPSGPTYRSQSRSDYYRNYNGIHPESERTFP